MTLSRNLSPVFDSHTHCNLFLSLCGLFHAFFWVYLEQQIYMKHVPLLLKDQRQRTRTSITVKKESHRMKKTRKDKLKINSRHSMNDWKWSMQLINLRFLLIKIILMMKKSNSLNHKKKNLAKLPCHTYEWTLCYLL